HVVTGPGRGGQRHPEVGRKPHGGSNREEQSFHFPVGSEQVLLDSAGDRWRRGSDELLRLGGSTRRRRRRRLGHRHCGHAERCENTDDESSKTTHVLTPFRPHVRQSNSATPTPVVTSVSGAPIRRNSQKPIRSC